jgi:hypothetical protein
MKYCPSFLMMFLLIVGCAQSETEMPADQPAATNQPTANNAGQDGWISLYDGATFDGWKPTTEHVESFRIEDGAIVANGERAHLFYDGPVENHNFTNFEFMAEVMTMPNANSGLYFHTEYQEEGWPSKGYESQINNSYDTDPRRTGSLYAVDDVAEVHVGDNEWFDYYIKVEGKTVTIKINGETLTDYTEPENAEREEEMTGRRLSSGTFAIQAHDPGSEVHIRNIRVRPM